MKMYHVIYLMMFVSMFAVLVGIFNLTVGFNLSTKIQLLVTTLLVSLVASMQVLNNLLLLILSKHKQRELKLTI